MLLKLNLEKAFDRLERGFIRESLTYFIPSWSNLYFVLLLLQYLACSIGQPRMIVNQVGVFIKYTLSPIYLHLCMKMLSRHINMAADHHFCSPVKISRKGTPNLALNLYR